MNGILKRLKFKMGKNPKHSILQYMARTYIHTQRAAQKIWYFELLTIHRVQYKAHRCDFIAAYLSVCSWFFFLQKGNQLEYIYCMYGFGAGIVSYWSKCILTLNSDSLHKLLFIFFPCSCLSLSFLSISLSLSVCCLRCCSIACNVVNGQNVTLCKSNEKHARYIKIQAKQQADKRYFL